MSSYDENVWKQFEDVDSVKVSGNIKKFKMSDTDEKARICFPLVNPKSKKVALIKVRKFSYNDKTTGRWATFQAPEDTDSEAYKVAVKYCGDPQDVYVTPVLVYSTNKQGIVINGDEYELTNLTLPRQRLQELKTLQDEYNISEIDLIVTCTEKQYQNLKLSPAKNCGLIDGVIGYKKDGKERNVEININADAVRKEALEMAKSESALAVAPKWSDQYIINYFTEDGSDYDNEPEDISDAPAKPKAKASTESDDFDDISDDDF